MQIAPQTLADLVERHGAALVLYARQWCLDPDDALQESLIELVRQQPPPDDPVAWLFTTTRRRAINQSRSASRRERHHRNAALKGDRKTDHWFEPDFDTQHDAERIQAILDGLKPTEREILVGRIWGGLTFQQLSQVVELPTSTVHRHYQNALTVMRNSMTQVRPP